MNNKMNKVVIYTDNIFKSKAGYEVNKNSTYWTLDKNNKVNVGAVLNLLDNDVGDSFVKTLAFYASNYSGGYTYNINRRILALLEATASSRLTSSALINYRSMLTKDKEWYLGAIKAFFNRWYELGYVGVTEEFIDLLNSWQLRGCEKGKAIKRLDLEKGPLSDIELLAFNEGSVQAYESNKISITDLAMDLICSNTGRRGIQISHLKIKDVLEGKNIKGEQCYFINIPRAKQQASNFRDHFKMFAITRELWVILNAQANASKRRIKEILKVEIKDEVWLEMPLFPDLKAFEEIRLIDALKKKLQSDYLHIKSECVTKTLKRSVKYSNICSERTGKLLNISAYRFRYTTGTRAAREGCGPMVIAELLDHSDNQNAGVYVENIPEHVEAIDQAVGYQLAIYAQAFSGLLVNNEREAYRGDDMSSRIKSSKGNMGTCGSHGFCGANVPVPCYTCIHFQPWLDGPHQEVYDNLIAERKRLIHLTGDMTISAINDRSILAVAKVIQLCAEIRKELNNG